MSSLFSTSCDPRCAGSKIRRGTSLSVGMQGIIQGVRYVTDARDKQSVDQGHVVCPLLWATEVLPPNDRHDCMNHD